MAKEDSKKKDVVGVKKKTRGHVGGWGRGGSWGSLMFCGEGEQRKEQIFLKKK